MATVKHRERHLVPVCRVEFEGMEMESLAGLRSGCLAYGFNLSQASFSIECADRYGDHEVKLVLTFNRCPRCDPRPAAPESNSRRSRSRRPDRSSRG